MSSSTDWTSLNPFERVKSSCKRVATESTTTHVTFSSEGATKFIEQYLLPNLQSIKEKACKKASLPFQFDSVDHEANYRCLYGLLQFGSGFRRLLHEKISKGACETIERGLINCFLSEDITISSLGVDMMDKVSDNYFALEQHFQVPAKEEAPHDKYPLIKVQKDSPLKPFAENLRMVLSETSRKLRERASDSFATFIRKLIAEYERKKQHEEKYSEVRGIGKAAFVVNELVKAFPSALDDSAQYENANHEKFKVFLYKKAQLIVAELHIHLHEEDPTFFFPDIHEMTIFVDNVIPATLIKAGVLEIDEEMKLKIHDGKPFKYGSPAEVELRALAVHASEEIIRIANSEPYNADINSLHLDYYLWGELGKQEEFRKFERHSTPDTVFY
ncbi:hypothetical protein C9374_008730 [Naegleria lovaniensis]|uniref:Queuosine 5'-phosphate N-glycosylase/hydrolase n=1 Tax=Naegleria lovaniensis TaxID=51637 RepID=A0AA88GGI1_NAELO|nr:uncharacterized protein C9374_008730 [Naegleria lovaniensis]KAG2378108.1 hypothetical protein C9374_008730 [Naegleria lovaniensis]